MINKKANLGLRFAFLHSYFIYTIENIKYLMLNGFFRTKVTVFFFLQNRHRLIILFMYSQDLPTFLCVLP